VALKVYCFITCNDQADVIPLPRSRIPGRLAIGLLVSGLMGAMCRNPFAPKLTQSLESSGLVVTTQQSPAEVLQNFKVAYTFRDSLLYSDLMDTAFQFVFFNTDEETSGRFESWGRDVDLRITGRMFRHFQVLDLIWKTTLFEVRNDSTAEMSQGFDLTLVAEDFDYKLSGKAVFSFRKCRDGKWRIIRWKDDTDT
jgi:hypothetical protein